jgi:hypothetical protein
MGSVGRAPVAGVRRWPADTRVDVATDWTFPSSLIGVYVIAGGCSLDQFNARTCLMKSEPSAAMRVVQP